MKLSFDINKVSNGYIVTLNNDGIRVGWSPGQTHVFNSSQEVEAFIRNAANAFSIEQEEKSDMKISYLGHSAATFPAPWPEEAATDSPPQAMAPQWGQTVGVATAGQ